MDGCGECFEESAVILSAGAIPDCSAACSSYFSSWASRPRRQLLDDEDTLGQTRHDTNLNAAVHGATLVHLERSTGSKSR